MGPKPELDQHSSGTDFLNILLSLNVSFQNIINPRTHIKKMENGNITKPNGAAKPPKQSKTMLWRHPDPDSTRMAEFMRGINRKYGLKLESYDDLYRWSIDDIASFWGEVWDFTGITAEKGLDEVCHFLIT
jgi:hypothetical protein